MDSYLEAKWKAVSFSVLKESVECILRETGTAWRNCLFVKWQGAGFQPVLFDQCREQCRSEILFLSVCVCVCVSPWGRWRSSKCHRIRWRRGPERSEQRALIRESSKKHCLKITRCVVYRYQQVTVYFVLLGIMSVTYVEDRTLTLTLWHRKDQNKNCRKRKFHF